MKIGDNFHETTSFWAVDTEIIDLDPDGGYVVRRKWRWIDDIERKTWAETVVISEERLKVIAGKAAAARQGPEVHTR